MFRFLGRLLGWANQQSKFLRFLIKYFLLLAAVMGVAFIVLPLLGGIAGLLTSGGLFGFFMGWGMTFGTVAGLGLPVLLVIFGYPGWFWRCLRAARPAALDRGAGAAHFRDHSRLAQLPGRT
jgi:hypothetical protein